MITAHRCVSLAAVAVVGFLSMSAARGDDGHGFDLRRRNKAAIRAWRKVVPAKYRKVAWIYSLDGTSVPIRRVKLAGRVYLTGTVCEPHDCGANVVAFVITPRGEAAYGLLRSENRAPDGDKTFGTPGPDEAAALRSLVDGGP